MGPHVNLLDTRKRAPCANTAGATLNDDEAPTAPSAPGLKLDRLCSLGAVFQDCDESVVTMRLSKFVLSVCTTSMYRIHSNVEVESYVLFDYC
jgi:hypothetical protein